MDSEKAVRVLRNNTKVAFISSGNIAHPSLSELVEPCRPTKMSVRYTLVNDLL
jgi:hypothetical protein